MIDCASLRSMVIFEWGDRTTVLRAGRWIGTLELDEQPTAKFFEWMLGRNLSEPRPRHALLWGL